MNLQPSDSDVGIHHAIQSTFIGLFRVPLSQMAPHSQQRMIDPAWVNTLKHKFEDGVDRAGHPVQGTLISGTRAELEELLRAANGRIPTLPSRFSIGVFDGQHRLEAWKLMAPNEQQRFWFAKIYGKSV
jgi:hypothetical protein